MTTLAWESACRNAQAADLAKIRAQLVAAERVINLAKECLPNLSSFSASYQPLCNALTAYAAAKQSSGYRKGVPTVTTPAPPLPLTPPIIFVECPACGTDLAVKPEQTQYKCRNAKCGVEFWQKGTRPVASIARLRDIAEQRRTNPTLTLAPETTDHILAVCDRCELAEADNAKLREQLTKFAVGRDEMSYHGELLRCQICGGSGTQAGMKIGVGDVPVKHELNCILIEREGERAALIANGCNPPPMVEPREGTK